jgi:hypothetical protein
MWLSPPLLSMTCNRPQATMGAFDAARETLKRMRKDGDRDSAEVKRCVDIVFKSKGSLGDEGRALPPPWPAPSPPPLALRAALEPAQP